MDYKVAVCSRLRRKTSGRKTFELGKKLTERPNLGGNRRQRVILELRIVLVKTGRGALRGVVVEKIVEVPVGKIIKVGLGHLRDGEGVGHQQCNYDDVFHMD